MSNFADTIEAGEDEFGGKTEWEDALIKHGIIGAPERKETEDERALEAAERYQNRDRLAGKTLEQLDELEDDEDEDVLDKYRQARLAQLKEQQARNKFGEYRQIAEPDFVGEVSKAGDDIFVVLHLFVHGKQECKLLHQILERLAVKFKYVKFLRIVSTECIHNYPDRNCPTVLIYNKGDIVRQIVGLELFGGLKSNADTVEWVLARSGVLTSELEDDPREALKTVVNRGSAALGRRGGFNDDEDDDDLDD